MKKFLLAVLGVAVIFSGCGNKKQDTEVNYFNGAGSLKSDSGRYATSVIYDDNTYYLRMCSIDSPFREQIIWNYMQTSCRPGVPDRNVDNWAVDIKN